MFRVKLVHEKAIKPSKSRKLDAGFDLYALDDVVIAPRSQLIVDTGIELVELPDVYKVNWSTVMLIWPRSGLDAKFALTTGAGVVDYLYRGQVLVLLKNESDDRVIIPYGKAIAQALIQPVWVGDLEVVNYSSESERGNRGGIAEIYNGTTRNFEDIGFAPKDKYTGGSLGFAYKDRTEE